MKELDDLMKSFSEELQNAAIVNHLPYIFTKASTLLKLGVEEYAKNDFFDHPILGVLKMYQRLKRGVANFVQEKVLQRNHQCQELGIQVLPL